MKPRLFVGFLALIGILSTGCQSESGTQSYSESVSKEVPKPKADSPTFDPPPGIKLNGSKGASGQGAEAGK